MCICKDNIRNYCLYALIICFVYSPLFIHNFALRDDYSILEIGLTQIGDILPWDIQNGRPLYGVLQYFTQYHMTSIQSLTWLRIFSIFSTIFFCIILHQFLCRRTDIKSKLSIFFLPLFLSLTPPFIVYNAWATCFPFVCSVCIAGSAYFCLYDAYGQTSWGRGIAAALLLIASFAIYQPTGMSFIFFMVLHRCLSDQKLQIASLYIGIIVFCIGMFASLLFAKILPYVLYGEVIQRSEFTHSPFLKLQWFIKRPFISAINNYSVIHTPIYYTVLSLILFLVGLFFIYKPQCDLQKIIFILASIIVIYTPNLVVKESWPAFRSQIGIELIVMTVIFYGITKLLMKIKYTYMYPLVIGILLVTASFQMQYIMNVGFIKSPIAEHRALTQWIEDHIPQSYSGKIRFDLTGSQNCFSAFTDIYKYDELGSVSMLLPWALRVTAMMVKANKHYQYEVESNMMLQPYEICQDNCKRINVATLVCKPSAHH